jgi:hypothetical protein
MALRLRNQPEVSTTAPVDPVYEIVRPPMQVEVLSYETWVENGWVVAVADGVLPPDNP